MKYSKILLAALAVMLVFAFAPMASADAPGPIVADPYANVSILYFGWDYEWDGFVTSMAAPPLDEFGEPVNPEVTNYTRDATNRSETYNIEVYNYLADDYIDVFVHYISLDTMNYSYSLDPNAVFNDVPLYATAAMENAAANGFDIVNVDMFYSTIMNTRNPDFHNASYNTSNTSIFTSSINGLSAINDTYIDNAPLSFDYRDGIIVSNGISSNSFTPVWHSALIHGNVSAWNTDFDANWIATLEWI
ncbi:hypothetical protein MmiAt1_07640 [Methanimicrococcus sp. At1]|uniref:Uncharacterized protein n=1 Tax=Methanimicrococcus hacksteinii TaxID=3028293 RepID=A0ABU3VP66_9EURY|nr:hypothetical protein [Methanimicrococcus sp. At1]MDV0445207.1 hypothetical protein [Methanimicrococcus sp. At1]